MSRAPVKRIVVGLAVLAIGLLTLGYAMAFFKPFTLFSATEGVVLMDGKPVAPSP